MVAFYQVGQEQVLDYLFVKKFKPLVYIGLAVILILMFYRIYNFYRRWTYKEQKISFNNLGERTKRAVYYGVFQAKVFHHKFPGIMHTFI